MARQSSAKEIKIGGVSVYPGCKINARWRGERYEGLVLKLGLKRSLCRVHDDCGYAVLVDPRDLKRAGTNVIQDEKPSLGESVLFSDSGLWIHGTVVSTTATGAALVRWQKSAHGASSVNWFELDNLTPIIHSEAYEGFTENQLEGSKSPLLIHEPKPRIVNNVLYQSDSEHSDDEYQHGVHASGKHAALEREADRKDRQKRMAGRPTQQTGGTYSSPQYESLSEAGPYPPLESPISAPVPLIMYPPLPPVPYPLFMPYTWGGPTDSPGIVMPAQPAMHNMPGFSRLLGRNRMNGLRRDLENSANPCVWSYGMRETKGIPPHSNSDFFHSSAPPPGLQYPRVSCFKPARSNSQRRYQDGHSFTREHSPTTLFHTQSEPAPYSTPLLHPHAPSERHTENMPSSFSTSVGPVRVSPQPGSPKKDSKEKAQKKKMSNKSQAKSCTSPKKQSTAQERLIAGSQHGKPRPVEYLVPTRSPQHRGHSPTLHSLSQKSTPTAKHRGRTTGPLKVVAPVRGAGHQSQEGQRNGSSEAIYAEIEDVGLPVIISSSASHMKVPIGGSITLSCIAAGSSQVYQWLKDNKRITDNDSFIQSTPGLMKITRAEPYMTGNYSCIIKNAYGSTKRHFHLEVMQDMLPTEQSYPRRVTYEEIKAAIMQEHAQEREVNQEDTLLTLMDGEDGEEEVDKGKEASIKQLLANELRGEVMKHPPLQGHTELKSGTPRWLKSEGMKRTPLSRRRISEVLLNDNEHYLEGYDSADITN